MNIESFKVIYNERVINPIDVEPSFKDTMPVNSDPSISKPNYLCITFIDEDGELAVVHDEGRKFKFVRR